MSSIKEKVNDYKKEIKISIVVSIITSLILYIIKLISNYLAITGGKLINVFTDFIYYEMGKMNDLTFVNFLGCFFLGILIAFIIILTTYVIFIKQIETFEKIMVEKIKYSRKKHYIINILKKIIYIISTLFIITYSLCIVYCSDCKREFDLDMTALKPYISQKEYDMLYSKWVTMLGKKDYLKIEKEMLELRCKYIIKDESIKKRVCK